MICQLFIGFYWTTTTASFSHVACYTFVRDKNKIGEHWPPSGRQPNHSYMH